MKAAKKLRSSLHRLCSRVGVRVPILAFERWQCRSKLSTSESSDSSREPRDPLLPDAARWVDRGLVSDLTRSGVDTKVAENIATRLAELSAAAVSRLLGAAASGPPVTVHATERNGHVDMALGSPGAKPYLRINATHYAKLRSLYRRAGGRDDEQSFRACVYCVLARYQALGGAGYQAAVTGQAFDFLRAQLGVQAECFASPLNCRFARFCSAFADVDAAFGSLGSFFAFSPKRGSFEANPPFVPELMLAMARRIDSLLSGTDEPLSFVVIVPAWRGLAFYRVLKGSEHTRVQTEVRAADHSFCDGAQHEKGQHRWTSRFRPSSFDTGVFVLQNDAGNRAWPTTDKLIPGLAKAMAGPKDVPSLSEYEKWNRGSKRRPQAAAGAPSPSKRSKRGRLKAPIDKSDNPTC